MQGSKRLLFVAFASAFAANGKLLANISCKEVCCSVEMIYAWFLIGFMPQIWEATFGLLFSLFRSELWLYLSSHAKEVLPKFSVTLAQI